MTKIHSKPSLLPLVPCLVVGDPDFKTSLEIAKIFAKNQVHTIEIIFPFSDPVADGPTICLAAERALKSGTDGNTMIRFIKACRAFTKIPLFMISYFNPILQYGIESFYKQAAEAGLSSILIPDLPPEEAAEAHAAARKYGIDQVFIVTPYTTSERMQKILKMASGFLYMMSRPGVTGVRKELDPQTSKTLKRLKKMTTLPLYVGFGISTRKHIQNVLASGADAAIAGSVLVKLIEENLKNPNGVVKKIDQKIIDLHQIS